jgi:four helix bundle protein
MSIKNFEEIFGWQKAKELTLGIYGLFKNNHDYSFRDQIQRASISIMNNIAEGFDRNSNADFKRFLFIARGSCGEVRSMAYIAYELHYIQNSDFKKILATTDEISKILRGLIKSL